jgi:hypothetical protein
MTIILLIPRANPCTLPVLSFRVGPRYSSPHDLICSSQEGVCFGVLLVLEGILNPSIEDERQSYSKVGLLPTLISFSMTVKNLTLLFEVVDLSVQ